MKARGTGNKRVVIVSDLHVGSACALRSDPQNSAQASLLRAWRETQDAFGRGPDLLVVNGDANDGQDPKGRDVANDSVPWQIEEAESLLLEWEPKRVVIVEGTAYHTGDTVQHERFLAGYIARRGVPCEFVGRLRMVVNGWFRLDARHKIGRSTVPQGAHTAPGRAAVNSVINAAIQSRRDNAAVDAPHLSVFSHVHYWSFAERSYGAYATTPCWKAAGCRFGETQCDGIVDIGAMQVSIGATETEGWTWRKRLYPARVEVNTARL